MTENGVLKLLKALNISKAAGPDGIRPRVLKELSPELAPILTLLFKASLHQQSFPDIWKHASVCPIYKKGDKTSPSNYRPVSLTCISCKLLEHIICSNLSISKGITFFIPYNTVFGTNVAAKLSS